MTTTVQITKCNGCEALILSPNQNGALRLAGTTIDFCSSCAEKTIAEVSVKFQMPRKPFMLQAKNANGQAVTPLPVENGVAYLGTETDGASTFAMVKLADGSTVKVQLIPGMTVTNAVQS